MFTPFASEDDRSFLLIRASRDLANRRKRAEKFGRLLFSDPAWDILLWLYINDDLFSPLELAQAVDFTAASGATVTRWLQSLAEQGLVNSAND